MNEHAPPKPGLVLNVAVAGARAISPEIFPVLTKVLGDVLSEFDGIVAGIGAGTNSRYELAAQYSSTKPVLRLVSGLADGADLLAADLHRKLPLHHVTHELGAVLAFDRNTYRDKSAVENKKLFNDLIGKCAWVHELDGHHAADPTDPHAESLSAKSCRARAYRAQSNILLRQCDVLIAISDPNEPGRAGGTRETLASAVELRVPVLHISLVDASVRMVKSHAEFDDLPFRTSVGEWRAALNKTIVEILAAPYRMHPGKGAATGNAGALTAEERKLFVEFFAPAVPKDGVLNRLWRAVDGLLKQPGPSFPDTDIQALGSYRKRAQDLSSHYSGKYRGAFVANFSLAVMAVFLATTSLLVALWLPETLTTKVLLVCLGVAKLAIIIAIFRTTSNANKSRWNELAVDYRYIAERLRAMNFLPYLGLLRAPIPSATQTSTRRLQQTIADWLALAIIRQAGLEQAAGNNIDPARGIAAIKDQWLTGQIAYHRSAAAKMDFMSSTLETAGAWFTYTVIACVSADLLLVSAAALHLLPVGLEKSVHDLTPLLLFFAAVLPAAVAGANGIRFQSESDRLAERSHAFANVLEEVRLEASNLYAEAIEARRTQANPGAWTGPAALMAEGCAQLFLDEVAEWSVLYAKELGDA